MTGEHSLEFSKRGNSLIGQEMFKILDRTHELERGGAKVYHLELGDPKRNPPSEIIDGTIRALEDLEVGYCPSGGLLELRTRIAKSYSSQDRKLEVKDVAVSPANLLISQFLDITCDRGDRSVLFTPAFPTYLAVCRHLGLDTQYVPLKRDHGFRLTTEDVDAALRHAPKVIIINSGNNPTGAIYDRKVLTYLVDRCVEVDCWLLSDETYLKLNFEKESFSLLEFEYSKILIISSFSKIFGIPAFRTGFGIGDPRLIEKVILSSSTLYSCLPKFAQIGICDGFDHMDSYLTEIRSYYQELADECVVILADVDNISCSMPDSGFYLFIDIRRTDLDSMKFSKLLLEEYQTAVTPGDVFGYRGFVRASICGEREDVREGIRRIGEFSSQGFGVGL